MKEKEFWNIVDGALLEGETPFFLEDHYLSYWNALDALSEAQLQEFAQMHSQLKNKARRENLVRFASELVANCTDDQLESLLAGLISRGEKVYSLCLQNPEQELPFVDRAMLLFKCSGFDYAHYSVYEQRYGRPLILESSD